MLDAGGVSVGKTLGIGDGDGVIVPLVGRRPLRGGCVALGFNVVSGIGVYAEYGTSVEMTYGAGVETVS